MSAEAIQEDKVKNIRFPIVVQVCECGRYGFESKFSANSFAVDFWTASWWEANKRPIYQCEKEKLFHIGNYKRRKFLRVIRPHLDRAGDHILFFVMSYTVPKVKVIDWFRFRGGIR